MRARHRLSKLLLRQGIVYSGGKPWTGRHDTWLRTQRFAEPGRQLAFESAYEAMCSPVDRRDRLDAAITEMACRERVHRRGAPAVLPARDLDVDRVRPGGGDRGLAPVHRLHDRGLPRSGPDRALLRVDHGHRGRSPRPGTPTPAGCWSRPPGTTAATYRTPGATMRARWEQAPPGRPRPRPRRQPAAAPPLAGHSTTARRSR